MLFKKKILGNEYKHSKRDFISNGSPGKANRMTVGQKRLCCGGGANIISVFKQNNQVCCPRIIRSGVNSNVSMTSNGTYKKRDDSKPYYYNSSQRLNAKKMSYKTNITTQKNNVSNCHSDKCSNVPVNNTRYGLSNNVTNVNKIKISHVTCGTDSGNRTFALSHASNTVFDKRKTKEEKNPNKNYCLKNKCSDADG